MEQMFARNFSTVVAVGRKSNPNLQLVGVSAVSLLICIKLNSAQLQLVVLGAGITLLTAAKASEALHRQLSLKMNDRQLLLLFLNL